MSPAEESVLSFNRLSVTITSAQQDQEYKDFNMHFIYMSIFFCHFLIIESELFKSSGTYYRENGKLLESLTSQCVNVCV